MHLFLENPRPPTPLDIIYRTCDSKERELWIEPFEPSEKSILTLIYGPLPWDDHSNTEPIARSTGPF